MHFSKIAVSLLTSLSLATAGMISARDSGVEEARYKIAENVYSNVPPNAYKIGDNVWSNVPPPAHDIANKSTSSVAKMDNAEPTFDDLKANVTLAMEWMMAHSSSEITDANESGVVARVDTWSDILARCIVSMGSCYHMVTNKPMSTIDKLNYCFGWSIGFGYCKTRTQSSYRSEFNGDFAPQDAVMEATEQLYVDYTGGQ
ncbi:hypothetical protein GGS24DRAFT_474894 [Hypoxylon argillaceum]|nr:hypothetical protein GGS24DRAFT_474894 [Hypoxylon argillaceum]